MKPIFYVYSYRDPLEVLPFYIGKGFGNRIYMHFAESNLLKKSTPFYRKLRSILLQNRFPVIEKIQESLFEEQAIKLERQLIEKYGKVESGGSLFNISSGGGKTSSKLIYVDNRQIDESRLKEISGKVLKGRKMEYDRQQTLCVINSNPKLAELHLTQCKEMSVDESLEKIYHEMIHESILYQEQYQSFGEKQALPLVGEDNKVVAEIRRLVEAYGWAAIIQGISDFADMKRKAMLRIFGGASDRSEQWKAINEKLNTVRRNVLE